MKSVENWVDWMGGKWADRKVGGLADWTAG